MFTAGENVDYIKILEKRRTVYKNSKPLHKQIAIFIPK